MTDIAPRDLQSTGEPDGLSPHAAALSRVQIATGPCIVILVLAMTACAPTVKVEAPKDPITINLNIQADVRVTLEEKAKEDISANPGVF